MKTVLTPVKFMSAQSLGSSFAVACPTVQQGDVVGIQLNYSGSSPTGTIEIQGSVDGVNFTALYLTINGVSGSSIALPASTTPIVVDLYGSSIPNLRVVYTRTSGSGTMDGFITYKRLGS